MNLLFYCRDHNKMITTKILRAIVLNRVAIEINQFMKKFTSRLKMQKFFYWRFIFMIYFESCIVFTWMILNCRNLKIIHSPNQMNHIQNQHQSMVLKSPASVVNFYVFNIIWIIYIDKNWNLCVSHVKNKPKCCWMKSMCWKTNCVYMRRKFNHWNHQHRML